MIATTRLLAGSISTIVLSGLMAGAATAAPPARSAQTTLPTASTDRTSPAEARRVDRVPTPRLAWYACYQIAECATVRLPLDYDKPAGATTEVAVLRIKARDQQRKIGSLFLNPGGPGGPGTQFALLAPQFLSDELLDRFDIVGVDPRGIGASEQLRCFRSVREQTQALSGFTTILPLTTQEERGFVRSSRLLGKACSSTGRPLSGAVSTAEVARDMDVLRRAVGDAKLSYLGFSYGSVLGQYYANMFPDRFRALTIDGVVDPTKWVGSPATQHIPLADRMRSADGAYAALREILTRCDAAGAEGCPIAGEAAATYDLVARRLVANPVEIEDPDLGTVRFTYADFVGTTLFMLYDPSGAELVAAMTAELLVLTDPGSGSAARVAARRAVAQRLAEVRAQRPGLDFPYDNSTEAQLGVLCTDARHPADAAAWPRLGALADRRAKYFGRIWSWWDSSCARNTWTVRDENAYRGPFTRRTAAPVLVVGNYWDPATNYSGAVGAARLLPNSRLLSSDSWGHTAYGTSACATDAIDAYLLTGAPPAGGTVCVGDAQPFEPAPQQRRPGGEPKRLPPVVPLVPAGPAL